MNDFFDSEIVKESLRDIQELQDIIGMNLLASIAFSDEDVDDELDLEVL